MLAVKEEEGREGRVGGRRKKRKKTLPITIGGERRRKMIALLGRR